ncbi:MAG: response regulator transcription factor [Gammaproteobacteria bacterium]|nr:response regulator transcription factor [Gammaproteobacteria bacterium]NNM14559.1 response regulator transcription factor [Gammaproteobacteria bacterium]
MRMLIIEDDQALNESLCTHFKDNGFVIDKAFDGREGLYLGQEFNADVGIIDLGLPEINGIDVIKQLRTDGKRFPILILTARDSWQDKVNGLQAGADDYVTKPFHLEEVEARVNALIRRAGGWAQPVLQCGPVSLDTRTETVKVDNAVMDLTSYEYQVLHYMMVNAGKVISKTELTEHLYEQDYERDSNVIEVFVGRLRRKLDPDNTLKPIETIRGRGYRLALARETDNSEE